jgi:aminoglycoside phosphotransferase (APT) family kinase protein
MNEPNEICQRLERFLSSRMPQSATVKVDNYEVIAGGYSRHMARFTAHCDGSTSNLIMRADPLDANVTIESDRAREWVLLRALTEKTDVPMPRALYYDEDGSDLGSKTIILEEIQGRSFLAEIRGGESQLVSDPIDAFAELAAHINRTDLSVLPEEIERPASWDDYVDGRIEEWRKSEQQQLDRNPLFRYIAGWLEDNRPEPAPFCLVHGELQPSNIMVDEQGQLLAVDWEMARIGDPREELGWCTWVESMQPPHTITKDPSRLRRLYAAKSGLDESLVTPEAIRYFTVIAGLQGLQGLYTQVRELAEGRNKSLLPAYLLSALTTAHEQWWLATR